MFSFALALSYHLNGQDYDLNSIHPHVRYTTKQDYLIGAYYNSDYNVSPYVAFMLDENVELGLVAGYGDMIYPYVRYVQDGFYVAPAIYNEGENSGLVIGYEIGF
jgi:hypothetical protein